MKKFLIVLLLVFLYCPTIFGQEVISTQFFNDEFGYCFVDKKVAKYYELTIKEPNKIIRYEMREKNGDRLINLRRFKKEIPVGKWYTINGGEVNHDSILHYDYANKKLIEKVKNKFEPPMLGSKDDTFGKFIGYRMEYPEYAAQNGIQGTVVSQFIIDETGNLIDLSIIKRVGELLDKESSRVIMLSPKWTPAKLDGKPIKVFVITQTTFVLK